MRRASNATIPVPRHLPCFDGGEAYQQAPSVEELTEKQRDALKKREFEHVEREGSEHLPIHDAAHVP